MSLQDLGLLINFSSLKCLSFRAEHELEPEQRFLVKMFTIQPGNTEIIFAGISTL